MAVLPAEVIAEARSLPRTSSMSLMTTAAPSRARVCTQASPIPDAPPVTSAIFPSTWPISASLDSAPHPAPLPAGGEREDCQGGFNEAWHGDPRDANHAPSPRQ